MNSRFLLFAAAVAIVVILAGIFLSSDEEVSWNELEEIDQSAYEKAKALSSGNGVTIEDIGNFTLYHCGLSDKIIGSTQFDRESLMENTGLMENIGKKYTDKAKTKDLDRMLSNSEPLKKAYSNGTPLFYNGQSQPLFEYTDDSGDDYNNIDSTVMRYCVYVETEYDTDSDGERDLVKVFLQVPRSAMEGNYKAPVILECNPYGAGKISEEQLKIEPSDSYDLSKLYSQPDPRLSAGDIGSMELALSASLSDWRSKTLKLYSSEHLYDYYLVRGYAVAICCGLGTYGSEGFVCTGTDLELYSYKSVIDWFDGDSVAYSDTDGCIRTEADWSNGNVGTMGISYLGTIQTGLAALGVDNLKAVVPAGAISNWYEYAYCQGAAINDPIPYIVHLDGLCSSRYIETGFSEEYRNYLAKLAYDETQTGSNYISGESEFWSSRDYRNLPLESDTAVLLIEGLNENNVRTKHFDTAYRMFSDAGYNVKAILHLGAHQTISGKYTLYGKVQSDYSTMQIKDVNCTEIINGWFSHYLFGTDNGWENFPAVSIQSNIDGSWSFYDDLPSSETGTYGSSTTSVNTISKKEYDADPVFKTESDGGRSVCLLEMENDLTISGVTKVNLKASTSNVIDNAMITVSLYDVCDEGVESYANLSLDYSIMVEKTGETMWVGGGLKDYDVVQYCKKTVPQQIITHGTVDLNNPSSDYESSSAVPETIEKDTMYEYNVYLYPTYYTVKAGHTLAIVIYTYDPDNLDYKSMVAGDYSVTIDEGSVTLTV